MFRVALFELLVWPHEVEPWFHTCYRDRVETLDAIAYINSIDSVWLHQQFKESYLNTRYDLRSFQHYPTSYSSSIIMHNYVCVCLRIHTCMCAFVYNYTKKTLSHYEIIISFYVRVCMYIHVCACMCS